MLVVPITIDNTPQKTTYFQCGYLHTFYLILTCIIYFKEALYNSLKGLSLVTLAKPLGASGEATHTLNIESHLLSFYL